MNAFANYTRQTAFSLTMSQAAIAQLLDMEVSAYPCDSGPPPDGLRNWMRPEYGCHIATKSIAAYLQRRGLITHATGPGCEDNWMLTEAGKLLAPLLKEAGFKPRMRRVVDGERAWTEFVPADIIAAN